VGQHGGWYGWPGMYRVHSFGVMGVPAVAQIRRGPGDAGLAVEGVQARLPRVQQF
jgi:hypothetical protein